MYRIMDVTQGCYPYDDGERYPTVAEARAAVEDPDWDSGYDSDTTHETWWADYDIIDADTGATVDTVTIALHPCEPPCAEPEYDEHDWKDGPVRGDGAGVLYTETCRHCGLERVTETRPQRRDTGAYAPTERIHYRRDGERFED